MRQPISFHFLLRVAPLMVLTILLAEELFADAAQMRAMRICIFLLVAVQLSQYYPLSYEDLSVSVRFMAGSFAYYIAVGAVPFCRENPVAFFLLPIMLFTMGYQSLRTSMKYREIAGLFRKDAPWCRMEEDSRTLYGYVIPMFVFLLSLMKFLQAPSYMYYPAGISLSAIYALLHYRSYTGRSLLLSQKTERRIRNLISAELREASTSAVDDDLLAGIYRRLQTYMQVQRPYLDDGFSLEDIADYLHLNKIYVSRAVNKYARKNVRQYINYYRVQYALEMMKKEPQAKVIELAFAAGFHSVVTFNMAFKLVYGTTPGDMIMRVRMSLPSPKPSMIRAGKAENREELSLRDEEE